MVKLESVRTLAFGLGITLLFANSTVFADDKLAAKHPASVRIAGRVLDADGKPHAAAAVSLFTPGGDSKPWVQKRRAKTAADGSYAFENLESGVHILVVDAAGFARIYHRIDAAHDNNCGSDLFLRQPGSVAIRLVNGDGKPIVGARVRDLEQRDANGTFSFGKVAFEAPGFNKRFPVSDAAGRLPLPPFPQGATLDVSLAHYDFAPTRVPRITVQRHTTVETVMSAGVTLTLHLGPPEIAKKVARPTLTLFHEPFDNPSTLIDEPLAFDSQGFTRLTVEPGKYRLLWLKDPDFLIGPRLAVGTRGTDLVIAQGKHDRLDFEVLPKVTVHGRLIEASTGKPVPATSISGEVLTHVRLEEGKASPEWMHADWGTTDEKGEYSLRLAAGPARVSCHKERFAADVEHLRFVVNAESTTKIPDLRIQPIPTIRGMVFGPDGRPAQNTVVRFRGKYFRWVNPTLTDPDGRFELNIPHLPTDDNDSRVYVHPLVAFHAYEPFGTRIDVHLDDPKSLANLTLKLQPEPYEHQLAEVNDEWTAWEKKDGTSAHVQGQTREWMRGRPAPELDCQMWLNVPKGTNKLKDFRGRYVLLDFWTTWCGPCRADFPSVQLAYELYKDQGLVVIGVHDNSVETPLIQKHVEIQKMSIPIAADRPDGRTLAAYYQQCGVEGYPSYLLLRPDGTILNADPILPGPTLRSFKLEIIRAQLMSARSHTTK